MHLFHMFLWEKFIRLVCKRLEKRKLRDPWHTVKHGFYFTFSSYLSLISVHEFQRGLWDNVWCKRQTYMITTSASTASLQVYINSSEPGGKQVCHSPLWKAPFHVKSRASGWCTSKYFTNPSNNHNSLTTGAVPLFLPVYPCLVWLEWLSGSSITEYFRGAPVLPKDVQRPLSCLA